MARKPADMVQLKLRFSEALRRRLEREAARNHRSMNTEIIHRLEESFFRGPGVDRQTLRAELRALLPFLLLASKKQSTQVSSVIQSAKPKIEGVGEKK